MLSGGDKVNTEAVLFNSLPLVQSFMEAFLPEGMTKDFWLACTGSCYANCKRSRAHTHKKNKSWEVLILNYEMRSTTPIPQIFKFSLDTFDVGLFVCLSGCRRSIWLSLPQHPQPAPNYLDAV